jgi:hypothetical protein
MECGGWDWDNALVACWLVQDCWHQRSVKLVEIGLFTEFCQVLIAFHVDDFIGRLIFSQWAENLIDDIIFRVENTVDGCQSVL